MAPTPIISGSDSGYNSSEDHLDEMKLSDIKISTHDKTDMEVNFREVDVKTEEENSEYLTFREYLRKVSECLAGRSKSRYYQHQTSAHSYQIKSLKRGAEIHFFVLYSSLTCK